MQKYRIKQTFADAELCKIDNRNYYRILMGKKSIYLGEYEFEKLFDEVNNVEAPVELKEIDYSPVTE